MELRLQASVFSALDTEDMPETQLVCWIPPREPGKLLYPGMPQDSCVLLMCSSQGVGTQDPSSFSSLAIFFHANSEDEEKTPTVKGNIELQRIIGKTS